jgi:pimeloyl-ACP methyl ester carboxylesterase
MSARAGTLALAAGASAGALLGWRAERWLLRSALPTPAEEVRWTELRTPLEGRERVVESFDGTRLHVEEHGDPDAPTIVLAHGYAMSLQTWRYQLRDLRERFHLVAFDHRGHGRSAPAAGGNYTIDALGRDLEAVLRACLPAGERALLVGHSMGGMTLLSWAAQHPDAVVERAAGAVFIDSTGGDVIGGILHATGPAIATLEMSVAERVWRVLERRGAVIARAHAASSDLTYLITRFVALSRRADPAHVAFVEQQWIDCAIDVKAAFGPALTSLNLRSAAPLLKVPALVFVGSDDKLTPRSSAEQLVEELPDARLIELPGVGHTAQIEAHEQITAALRDFAERVLEAG